ncbi:MAG: peptidase MA family metallohydrolase, partial [bacterium]
ELAHIGLYLATGGQNLMKWFEEGFAQYYSGELNTNVKILMAQRMLTGNFLSLKEIDDVFNLKESEASLAYGEALAAVSYLIETGGWEAFKIFIQNLKQRGNMELAMQAALGMGLDEFEAEWIATMKKRYLWLVIFDYRLIISILFIVLFLSAYLIKIKNTRKIKQNWEKEDIEIYQAHEENTLDQENSIQN